MGRRPGRRTATAAAVGTLAVSNVVVNRLLPQPAYVPWNLGVAAGLVGLARAAGVEWSLLGLDPKNASHGVRLGARGAGVVALAYGLALAAGDDRTVLQDRRVTTLRPREAWFQATVRIPLGTVVLEEVAFRGVVPALLRRARTPPWVAALSSAVLFGVWHVLPSRALVTGNDAAGRLAGRVGPAGARGLAVAGSAVAGLVLHALRQRGRHLAAPMVVHWATNALGLAAARLATRGWPRRPGARLLPLPGRT